MIWLLHLLSKYVLVPMFLLALVVCKSSYSIPHYFCTSADGRFYGRLCNLIATIHKNDREHLAEIAVFDLGFTKRQRKSLHRKHKVKVYDLEMVHPDLKKNFITSPQGRKVKGWFAWKPVAIKQALDMFPYILYLDAGMEVLQDLDAVFQHIKESGYWLIDSGEPVEQTIPYRITRTAIDRVVKIFSPSVQDRLLSTQSSIISAGIQGLSRTMLESYVNPVFQWVTRDIAVFSDDGTAKLGFGAGRHDQIIFSLYAHLNELEINHAGWQNIRVGGELVRCHAHWRRRDLNEYSVLKY